MDTRMAAAVLVPVVSAKRLSYGHSLSWPHARRLNRKAFKVREASTMKHCYQQRHLRCKTTDRKTASGLSGIMAAAAYRSANDSLL
jgi:hypothetical protein